MQPENATLKTLAQENAKKSKQKCKQKCKNNAASGNLFL